MGLHHGRDRGLRRHHGRRTTRVASNESRYLDHLCKINIWLTHMHRNAVHRKLKFGPFELSIGERVLRRDGRALPRGDRALDILTYLADQPGEVIAKQELM